MTKKQTQAYKMVWVKWEKEWVHAELIAKNTGKGNNYWYLIRLPEGTLHEFRYRDIYWKYEE
jgi:hypothetical protein